MLHLMKSLKVSCLGNMKINKMTIYVHMQNETVIKIANIGIYKHFYMRELYKSITHKFSFFKRKYLHVNTNLKH